MSLKISPTDKFGMDLGEEVSYTLNINKELGTNTIASYTYKIYNGVTDVTATFGGGSSITAGIITFGIKAYAVGTYTLQFIVTCNEVLPDAVTPNEFYVEMIVIIE